MFNFPMFLTADLSLKVTVGQILAEERESFGFFQMSSDDSRILVLKR